MNDLALIGQKVKLPFWIGTPEGWIVKVVKPYCWVAFPLIPGWKNYPHHTSKMALWSKQFSLGAFWANDLVLESCEEYKEAATEEKS